MKSIKIIGICSNNPCGGMYIDTENGETYFLSEDGLFSTSKGFYIEKKILDKEKISVYLGKMIYEANLPT